MKHKLENIGIAVLAAGNSSRMGQPKQLLKWGNETLIGNAVKTALATTAKDVFVVLGANYQLIMKEVEKLPIQILKNDDWQEGLGSSIACTAKFCENNAKNMDGLIFTLADQPLITSGYLQKMITNFQVGYDQIVATEYESGKKGVPALFDKIYFSELSAITGDDGAKSLLIKHTSNVSTMLSEANKTDIDTLEDYHKLRPSHS